MKIELKYSGTETVAVTVNSNAKYTTHFRYVEVANNKAKEDTKFVRTERTDTFMEMLEVARRDYGKPMNLNSVYRTASFNRSIGGDRNSEHLDGLAADVQLGRISDAEWKVWVNRWEKVCSDFGVIGQIRRYNWGIHLGGDYSRYGYKSFGEVDCRG